MKIKKNALLSITTVLALFFMSFGCAEQRSDQADPKDEGVLLFNSGFESGSQIKHGANPFTSDDDIVGVDLSVAPPNDWVVDIDNSNKLGRFSLQYQGGDTTMRFARIVPEPGNTSNKVLHFWLNYPNVDNGAKARIQANIYEGGGDNMEGIKELYQSVRLFLHEDMEVVKSYPKKISWLTILEVWNNIQWVDDPHPYRLTVGIGKPTAESRNLHFMVDAEDYEYATETTKGRYIELWHYMNTNVSVPVGKWITLEYYIKEGNAENGRFYMAMTPEGGEKQVVFDIINFTHNSKDANPDGITLWNPLKLYTSKELVNYVRDQGKSLQFYWDDFEIWKDKQP
jgi:hypothetical protein